MQIEYFFDCSSPWTYLSYKRIPEIAARYDAELIWRPILVGGVFNTVNSSVYAQRANPVPAKAKYYQKDLQDWAAFQDIHIGAPEVFPVNSVKAMRGCFVAMEAGLIAEYAGHVFEQYWGAGRDISDESVLADIVGMTGLNKSDFFNKIASDPYKKKLRTNTDELITRGGFGSPTFYLQGTDMYFGNDRLVLIEHRLARAKS